MILWRLYMYIICPEDFKIWTFAIKCMYMYTPKSLCFWMNNNLTLVNQTEVIECSKSLAYLWSKYMELCQGAHNSLNILHSYTFLWNATCSFIKGEKISKQGKVFYLNEKCLSLKNFRINKSKVKLY